MKIRSGNSVYSQRSLVVSETLEYYDSGMTKIKVYSPEHDLITGDYITLYNDIGGDRKYIEHVKVTVIDKNNFYFDALSDKLITLQYVNNQKRNYYIYKDESNNVICKKANVVTLKLSSGVYHSFIDNKDLVTVNEKIDEYYYKHDIDRYKKRCVGDYVTCDCFLHKATGIDSFMYQYIIDPNIENICDRYIWYKKTKEITTNIKSSTFHVNVRNVEYKEVTYKLGGGVLSGESEIFETASITNKRSKNSDVITGNGVLVTPVNSITGKDLPNYLYWVFDAEDETSCDILKDLSESATTIDFFCKDERFYREDFKWEECGNEYYDYIGVSLPDPCWQYDGLIYKIVDKYYICKRSGSVTLNKDIWGNIGTSFYKDYGNIFINIPFAQDFSTDTFKELKFNEYYIDNVIDEKRNDIIDYEKVQFSPMYIESDSSFDIDSVQDTAFKPVNEIEFNLHFLKRNFEEIETKYGNAEVGFTTFRYREYGDWPNNKKEDDYWNFVSIGKEGDDGKCPITYNGQTEYYSDLIGDLGFYDDDVFYQKARLQNSFLRLSFYDSRNRGSQTLMFYANVYFDTNNLYNKYIKILASENTNKDDDSKYVYENFDLNEDLRLSSRFTIKSKYESTNSSEGFYMYTYPSIVDGNKLTPLYMKVEFNHAKYGTTTGLYMPTDDNGIPSDLIVDGEINSKFPLNYMKTQVAEANNSGITEANEIDMEKVLMDTYIKVYVKYDFKHKQYIWFLPRTTGEDSKHIIKKDGKIIFNLFEPKVKNTGDDKLTV